MPNFAVALKEEIRRLAKKEVKAETGSTKHTLAQHRRDIAQLKRLLGEQEKTIAMLKRQVSQAGEPETKEGKLEGVRHSARSVRSQRKRLGVSAADFGRLVGVSGLTVYHWEHGKSCPRKAQLVALVAVRKIGKREALARLETLGSPTKKLGGKKPR